MYLGDSNNGSPIFGMSPLAIAVQSDLARYQADLDYRAAQYAIKADALRVLLNARRERQDKPWEATTSIAYCYNVRDDEDDSPLVESVATVCVPTRAATAPNGAWLYRIPSSGNYSVRGHGEVKVIQRRSTSPEHSTSVIIRGGLAVAYLRTCRMRYTATVKPMVGAWQNSIAVEWIEVDLSDLYRRTHRHEQRLLTSNVRKTAFAAAVDVLLSGGSLDYEPGANGGRVVYTTNPYWYTHAVSLSLSANAVLRACHLSADDTDTAIARATITSYGMLSLPVPFDDNIVAPCCGVVKQLHKRAARLPARDRRNAVTEWCEEEAA